MFRGGSQTSVFVKILGDSNVRQSSGTSDLTPKTSPESNCYWDPWLLLNSPCPLILIIFTSMTTKWASCACRTEAKSLHCVGKFDASLDVEQVEEVCLSD